MLTATGYLETLKKEDTAEADARVENLQELVGSMQDYEAEAEAAGEAPALAGFLERVTLVSDVDAHEGRARTRDAHDGARRQGPRVRARAAHRHGGGDVPVQGHRSGRARRARGGAAPRVRGDHARAQGARHDAHADAPDLRDDALEPAEPLHRRAAAGRRGARERHARWARSRGSSATWIASRIGGAARRSGGVATTTARRSRVRGSTRRRPVERRRRTRGRASWTTSSSTTGPTTSPTCRCGAARA